MNVVTDIFGEELCPGDIILYVSSMKKHRLNDLKCGVYMSHFNKKDGWKIRVRNPFPNYSWKTSNTAEGYADNARVTSSGRAEGVVRVGDPKSVSIDKIQKAIKLRDNLVANGKVKVETPVTKEETVIKIDDSDSVDLGNILGGLGMPGSLK